MIVDIEGTQTTSSCNQAVWSFLFIVYLCYRNNLTA